MPTSTPKEHPILFSGEMVRAVLDGRKTQTRRVMKRVNGAGEVDYDLSDFPTNGLDRVWFDDASGEAVFECQSTVDDTTDMRVRSPFGGPGDRLWVRETWCTHRAWDNVPPRDVPKGEFVLYAEWQDGEMFWGGGTREELARFGKTRPSIHMPRWASRITLEVARVRVERVQKITPEDCWAEGILVDCPSCSGDCYHGDQPTPRRRARRDFRELWNTINTQRGHGWNANPWVWVVEFRRPTYSVTQDALQ